MGNEGIKLLRVRRDVAERIERLAAAERRATGENIEWSEVARRLLARAVAAAERRSRKRET